MRKLTIAIRHPDTAIESHIAIEADGSATVEYAHCVQAKHTYIGLDDIGRVPHEVQRLTDSIVRYLDKYSVDKRVR